MCVTVHPALMDNTLTGSWILPDRTQLKVYENKASTSFDNYMILPIDTAKPDTLQVLDFTGYEDFLWKLHELQKNPIREAQKPIFRGVSKSSLARFVTTSVYEIVVVNEWDRVNEFLQDNGCPTIPFYMTSYYANFYRNYTMVLCRFKNRDMKRTVPMGFHFEALDEDITSTITLDSHDGKIPEIGKDYQQYTQRVLIGGNNSFSRNNDSTDPLSFDGYLDISKFDPKFEGVLPKYCFSDTLNHSHIAGDILFNHRTLHNSIGTLNTL